MEFHYFSKDKEEIWWIRYGYPLDDLNGPIDGSRFRNKKEINLKKVYFDLK